MQNGVDRDGYTQEQRVMLNEAKSTHKATTASAQRALQVGHPGTRVTTGTCEQQHLNYGHERPPSACVVHPASDYVNKNCCRTKLSPGSMCRWSALSPC